MESSDDGPRALPFDAVLDVCCAELADTVGRLERNEATSATFQDYVGHILGAIARSTAYISRSDDLYQRRPWICQPSDVVANIVVRVARASGASITEAWAAVDKANAALEIVGTESVLDAATTDRARTAALFTVITWINSQFKFTATSEENDGETTSQGSTPARSASAKLETSAGPARSVRLRKVLAAAALIGVLVASYADLALTGSLIEVQVLLTASLTAWVAQRGIARNIGDDHGRTL